MLNGHPAAADATDRPGQRPDPTIADEEKPARALTGPVGAGIAAVSFVIAVFALYEALRPLPVLVLEAC
jgi:hypothetical protein